LARAIELYTEGKAAVRGKDAFLNPKAKVIRDLSVAFVAALKGKGATVLDPTAATGIRGIRYYLEAGTKDVTLLEINRTAYLEARKNARTNKTKIKVYNKSIQEFANVGGGRFDVIDFDPFGGIAPNLYDIMKLAKDQTLLMLTATDTAVLNGAHSNACIRIYGSVPMHNELCHETGLRVLIGYAQIVAAQFNFGISVLLGMSYAHYDRVFLTISHGAKEALRSAKQTGYAYYCTKCGFRTLRMEQLPSIGKCPNCSSRIGICGKMWAGNLTSRRELVAVRKKLAKVPNSEEAKDLLDCIMAEPDVPLYYSIPKTTKLLGMPAVSHYKVIDALKKKGFRAAKTHFEVSSIKTDAPIRAIKQALGRLG
jgi:tRNA (guanine26-N2/guanine27-N2)-dimethyltransferase